MEGIGWISFLIIGLIAGWIAEKVMSRSHGLLTNLIVGVVGAYLGAIIFSLLGLTADSFIGALAGGDDRRHRPARHRRLDQGTTRELTDAAVGRTKRPGRRVPARSFCLRRTGERSMPQGPQQQAADSRRGWPVANAGKKRIAEEDEEGRGALGATGRAHQGLAARSAGGSRDGAGARDRARSAPPFSSCRTPMGAAWVEMVRASMARQDREVHPGRSAADHGGHGQVRDHPETDERVPEDAAERPALRG